MRKSKPPLLLWLVLATVVVVAIVAAYSLNGHGLSWQDVTNATTRQPERFTELFFANPNALPNKVKAGQQLPVSFVVRNQESRDMDYSYRITFTDAVHMTATLDESSLHVPSNAARSVAQNIVVPASTGRGEIVITLLNKSQSIHFWLERV